MFKVKGTIKYGVMDTEETSSWDTILGMQKAKVGKTVFDSRQKLVREVS